MAAEAVGRLAIEAWQAALVASGLPVAGLEPGGPGRARVAFAAPLPAAASGEAELVDLWLLDRRAAWEVRAGLEERLPHGHHWISAENVWLGAPALAGRVVAADWRVALTGVAAKDRAALAQAASALLAAVSLPRIRTKGAVERRYDLRLLLVDVALLDEGGPGLPALRIRTRFDPELGSGRPEEVVAALVETANMPIGVGSIARERLILADDLPRADDQPRPDGRGVPTDARAIPGRVRPGAGVRRRRQA